MYYYRFVCLEMKAVSKMSVFQDGFRFLGGYPPLIPRRAAPKVLIFFYSLTDSKKPISLPINLPSLFQMLPEEKSILKLSSKFPKFQWASKVIFCEISHVKPVPSSILPSAVLKSHVTSLSVPAAVSEPSLLLRCFVVSMVHPNVGTLNLAPKLKRNLETGA